MAEFRSWRLDFDEASSRNTPDPPGFDPAAGRELSTSRATTVQDVALVRRKKQEALTSQATGQLKNVGMLCFMMYMSGNQIHIFSIMTTFSGLYQSIMSIVNSGEAYKVGADSQLDTLTPRLMHCAIHAVGLAYAAYKLGVMGLLPTNPSDFMSSRAPPRVLEYSAGGLVR